MGTVVEPVIASIPGTKFRAEGPLLITHWGMSGPATLKLSSHAARYLNEQQYQSPVAINWTGESRRSARCGCHNWRFLIYKQHGQWDTSWENILLSVELEMLNVELCATRIKNW